MRKLFSIGMLISAAVFQSSYSLPIKDFDDLYGAASHNYSSQADDNEASMNNFINEGEKSFYFSKLDAGLRLKVAHYYMGHAASAYIRSRKEIEFFETRFPSELVTRSNG